MNDTDALTVISKLTSAFLPWTTYAMRARAIQIALNDLEINRHRHVLELGTGLSTVFLAEYLAKMGGTLITVDHDQSWLDQVKGWLTPSAAAVTKFVCAPLESTVFNGNSVVWYNRIEIFAALQSLHAQIDLLVVDGPPSHEPARPCFNRGPAFENLSLQLVPGCTIILDDLARPGERLIAKKWSEYYGVEHQDLSATAGIALWTPRKNTSIVPRQD